MIHARKIAFVRSNYPDYEPRTLNYLSVLKSFDLSVIVWDRENQEKTEIGWRVYRKVAPFGMRSLSLLFGWWKFVIISLVKENPDIVHACNIESCIPASIYCFLKRKKCIYDIWDTTGGMIGSQNTLITSFCNFVDRTLILLTAGFFVPDLERLPQLAISSQKIRKPFLVVPNSQIFAAHEKKLIAFKHTPIKLLYIGTLVKEVRGLEMLIAACKKYPSFTLDIAGYGTDEAMIKKLCESLSARCHFHGRAGRCKADTLLAESDIVVSLLSPTFENYKYATSTKIFEAFSLVKPVITTSGTASGSLVEKTHWGFVVPFTQEALENLLNTLATTSVTIELDPVEVNNYDWKIVSKKVKEFYENISRK